VPLRHGSTGYGKVQYVACLAGIVAEAHAAGQSVAVAKNVAVFCDDVARINPAADVFAVLPQIPAGFVQKGKISRQ